MCICNYYSYSLRSIPNSGNRYRYREITESSEQLQLRETVNLAITELSET